MALPRPERKTIRRPSTPAQAFAMYVDLLRDNETVREIALFEDPGEPLIWTLISAPPFKDKYRWPVLAAQFEVMKASRKPLDFRLINVEELPSESWDRSLPEGATKVWKRENASLA